MLVTNLFQCRDCPDDIKVEYVTKQVDDYYIQKLKADLSSVIDPLLEMEGSKGPERNKQRDECHSEEEVVQKSTVADERLAQENVQEAIRLSKMELERERRKRDEEETKFNNDMLLAIKASLIKPGQASSFRDSVPAPSRMSHSNNSLSLQTDWRKPHIRKRHLTPRPKSPDPLLGSHSFYGLCAGNLTSSSTTSWKSTREFSEEIISAEISETDVGSEISHVTCSQRDGGQRIRKRSSSSLGEQTNTRRKRRGLEYRGFGSSDDPIILL